MYICNMNNRKPTFAQIGKIDDPVSKSKGPFLLLLNRDFITQETAVFNFDPDIVFYPRRPVRQMDLMEMLNHDRSWDLRRGYR